MVHIGRGVVKPEWHTFFFASVRPLPNNVLANRSIRNLVVRVGRVEHAKAIVVFRREHQVFLSCGPSQINESIRIELCWIKPLWQLAILSLANAPWFGRQYGPGGLHTGQRVWSPV